MKQLRVPTRMKWGRGGGEGVRRLRRAKNKRNEEQHVE